MRTHATLKRLAYQLHLTEEFGFLFTILDKTCYSDAELFVIILIFQGSRKTVLFFGKYLAVSHPPPPTPTLYNVEPRNSACTRPTLFVVWGGGELVPVTSELKNICIDVITLC